VVAGGRVLTVITAGIAVAVPTRRIPA